MVMYGVSQFGNEDSSQLNRLQLDRLQLDFEGGPQNVEQPMRNKWLHLFYELRVLV
jgi:hypothetical protein